MRNTLLALALTSNAVIADMDADSGGGSARYYSDPIPRLGAHDAPHLHYGRLYSDAREQEDLAAAEDWYTPRLRRRQVLEWAASELDQIRHSRSDLTRSESRQDLYARIVREWHGVEDIRVALAARCLLRWVHEARRLSGHDERWGRRRERARALGRAQRQARARELELEGLNGRQIARALDVPYTTVLRDLGRRTN